MEKIIQKIVHVRLMLKFFCLLAMLFAAGCTLSPKSGAKSSCQSSFPSLAQIAAGDFNKNFLSRLTLSIDPDKPLRLYITSENFDQGMISQLENSVRNASRRKIAFLSRKDAVRIQKERSLKRNDEADRGALGLAKIAAADYLLASSLEVSSIDQRVNLVLRLVDLETSATPWSWVGCLNNTATKRLIKKTTLQRQKKDQGASSYFSLSGGYALSSDIELTPSQSQTRVRGITLMAGDSLTFPFESGYYAAGAFGFSSPEQIVRLEIEGAYSEFEGKEIEVVISGFDDLGFNCGALCDLRNGINLVDTKLTEGSLAVNMYITFNPNDWLRPYIGLGLGAKFWNLSAGPFKLNRSAFLLPLMLGLDHQLTDNLFISAEYRLDITTTLDGDDPSDDSFESNELDAITLLSHNFIGKIRWEY